MDRRVELRPDRLERPFDQLSELGAVVALAALIGGRQRVGNLLEVALGAEQVVQRPGRGRWASVG